MTTPGTVAPEPELAVFGRGTDSAVWWKHHTATGWTSWQSLGGQVASTYVFVLGTDNRIWMRAGTLPNLGGWKRL